VGLGCSTNRTTTTLPSSCPPSMCALASSASERLLKSTYANPLGRFTCVSHRPWHSETSNGLFFALVLRRVARVFSSQTLTNIVSSNVAPKGQAESRAQV
jgi:hypothetical protein